MTDKQKIEANKKQYFLDKTLLDAKDAKEIREALEAGANINAQDDKGDTILMKISRDFTNFDAETEMLLTSYYPDTDIQNKDGETALMIATKTAADNYVQYDKLKSQDNLNATQKSKLNVYKKSMEKYIDLTSMLVIDMGASTDITDKQGKSFDNLVKETNSPTLKKLINEVLASVPNDDEYLETRISGKSYQNYMDEKEYRRKHIKDIIEKEEDKTDGKRSIKIPSSKGKEY